MKSITVCFLLFLFSCGQDDDTILESGIYRTNLHWLKSFSGSREDVIVDYRLTFKSDNRAHIDFAHSSGTQLDMNGIVTDNEIIFNEQEVNDFWDCRTVDYLHVRLTPNEDGISFVGVSMQNIAMFKKGLNICIVNNLYDEIELVGEKI